MEAITFYRRILTGAILFVLFRLPVFGILALVLGPDIKGFARYCVFLPIVVAILICFCKARTGMRHKELALLIFIVFTVLAGIANILLLKEYYPELELNSIIRDMSIFHLFLIFPLLLLILPFKENDYRCMLDNIVIMVINIGGPLIIFETLGYALGWFTHEDTYDFIGGVEIYNLRQIGGVKPLGILADSAISGILFAACTVYCLVRKVSLPDLHVAYNQNSTKFRWATIILGMSAVLSAASLTPILIMIATMFYGILKYARTRLKLLYIPAFAFLFFVGIIYCQLFNISEYFMNYVRERDYYIPLFLPELTWGDFHLWGYFEEGSNHIGEFHFFAPMFQYGFLFFIPWILLMLCPLAKVLRLSPVRAQDRAPMLLCLVFLLAIVHYSGLERWGNNYIYALAAFMLFKSDHQNRTVIAAT